MQINYKDIVIDGFVAVVVVFMTSVRYYASPQGPKICILFCFIVYSENSSKAKFRSDVYVRFYLFLFRIEDFA